ncbi:MAG: iron-sulfur cluster assembly scaffold protein [Rhodospirillales bacterium]|jgi:nitrogen fixation NifU-like protein
MTGDDLYQDEIVARAKAGAADTRLDPHDARATVDNPLCGDRVTLDLRLAADGRVAQIGHRTRGCALCQASAETLRRCAPGLPRAEAPAMRDAVAAFLHAGAALPERFGDFAAFAPVRAYPSRQSCVLLPLDALAEVAADDPAGR